MTVMGDGHPCRQTHAPRRPPVQNGGRRWIPAPPSSSWPLAWPAPTADTVRVAGITVENMAAFDETWAPLRHGRTLGPEQLAAVRSKTRDLHAALFAASVAVADRGAQVILWSEGNALVLGSDAAELIETGRRFAAERHVDLFLSLAVITPGQPLVENKTVRSAWPTRPGRCAWRWRTTGGELPRAPLQVWGWWASGSGPWRWVDR